MRRIVARTMQGILLGALVIGLFLAMTSVASAGLVGIRLMTGGVTTDCIDGGACDLNPIAGVVTFSGAVGAFNVNVTTGTGYPFLGGPSMPWIDMNSLDAKTFGGPAELHVYVSQADFTASVDVGSFDGGGTQNNMSSFHEVWYDNSNALFGLGTLIDSHPAVAPATSFSWSNAPAVVGEDSLYSLTLRAVLIAGEGVAVTSFNHEFVAVEEVVGVPEPGLALLLGSALGLMGVARGRRRSLVTA